MRDHTFLVDQLVFDGIADIGPINLMERKCIRIVYAKMLRIFCCSWCEKSVPCSRRVPIPWITTTFTTAISSPEIHNQDCIVRLFRASLGRGRYPYATIRATIGDRGIP